MNFCMQSKYATSQLSDFQNGMCFEGQCAHWSSLGYKDNEFGRTAFYHRRRMLQIVLGYSSAEVEINTRLRHSMCNSLLKKQRLSGGVKCDVVRDPSCLVLGEPSAQRKINNTSYNFYFFGLELLDVNFGSDVVLNVVPVRDDEVFGATSSRI